MKKKFYNRKKEIITIIVALIIVLFLILWNLIKSNNTKPISNNKIDNKITGSIDNGFINQSNWNYFINVTGNIVQQEGKYIYEIKLIPKENLIIENLTAEAKFKFMATYLVDKEERTTSIRLNLKDTIPNEDGTYSFKGEYIDQNKKMLSVELSEDDYQTGIHFTKLNGKIYHTEQ